MKFKLIFIFALVIFSATMLNGQTTSKKQIKVAEKFLSYLMDGQNEKCWELFDTLNVPNVTKDQFDVSMNQIRKDLSLFESFELTMTGAKFIDTIELNLYSFTAISNNKNVTDVVLVDFLFFVSSNLIAGIQPKTLLNENTATTSKGKETPLLKDTTIVIDNISYNVTGINIVHFENGEGLLAIQLEYEIPAEMKNLDKWANQEAIKFAKYIYQNGYLEKAKIKAKEMDLKLLENIGVSFLDMSIGTGYNVMIEPEQYK